MEARPASICSPVPLAFETSSSSNLNLVPKGEIET
jgi:hypothetical protein